MKSNPSNTGETRGFGFVSGRRAAVGGGTAAVRAVGGTGVRVVGAFVEAVRIAVVAEVVAGRATPDRVLLDCDIDDSVSR